MRVLVLAPQPFYQERGTPIAVRIAVETLAKKLNLTETSEPGIDLLCYPEGTDITIPGTRILRVKTPRWLRGIRPGISLKKLVCDVFFLFAALALVFRNRKNPYSVVHAVEESVFIAWFIKKVWGIPYIYDMDSSMSLQVVDKWRWSKPLLPLMELLEGIAVRSSIAVAPVCDALEALATKLGSPHTVMLRDISLLSPAEARDADRDKTFGLSLDSHQPIILYVGNLEFYQGIDLLLESFSIVTSHPSHPHLVIIGGNQSSIELYQRKSAELSCAQSVSFLGPRPVSDLFHYLSLADVVVSPRIKGNNTPMKIYSYLHSGRALLATDLPTHRQILDDEIALLAPNEPIGFSEGLRRLLDSPSLRAKLGEHARERAERLYTLAAFETQLFALYDEVKERIAPRSASLAPEEA